MKEEVKSIIHWLTIYATLKMPQRVALYNRISVLVDEAEMGYLKSLSLGQGDDMGKVIDYLVVRYL